MPSSPFTSFLDSEGLTFGLPDEICERIADQTRKGVGCDDLLDDPALGRAGVGPTHLLPIRRAWRRWAGRKETPEPDAARRWAGRQAGEPDAQERLAAAFRAAVAATLKRGRLRFHLKRPEDPRAGDLSWLAEHSEGCEEIPAHRWFAARRAVRDGLVWVEVVVPEGEIEQALGRLATSELADDLARSQQKAVLDSIGARSEREVIATAAESLYGLLSRPPIRGPVAGVAVSRKRMWICVVDESGDEESEEFGSNDLEGAGAWLNKREVRTVGVARAGGSGQVSAIIKSLAGQALTVEPVREAGLMKQAGKRSGPIKNAAAAVVAWRLKNPLDGFAGLQADELGLGEYTDQVDPAGLKAALEDARQVVAWERRQGKTGKPVARGMEISPMVKGLADLRAGMELTGTVSNLTHFGAFVELGLSCQGLIHLSELSDQFVKHPSQVVQVGDRVRVRVLEVDQKKNRISLSMRAGRDGPRPNSRDRRSAALSDLDKLFKK